MLTYTLSGEPMMASSQSTVSSGVLIFDAQALPNFEALGSADGDNVYEVTVKAASTAVR